MSKTISIDKLLTKEYREVFFRNTEKKIFELYMSLYESPQFNFRENYYFFRKLWANGSVAIFQDKYAEEGDSGVNIAPYAYASIDKYGFAKYVNIVNEYNAPGYPTSELSVGKQAVIAYANKALEPIKNRVDWYVNRMTDVEMILRVNLMIQKMPWILNSNPENKQAIQVLINRLMNDEPLLFMDKGVGNFEVLTSGAPYIIDKLYAFEKIIENELLTWLGINNLSVQEKKERLLTGEIDINNQLVCAMSDNFIDCLQACSEDIYRAFGIEITFNIKHHIEEEPVDDSKESEVGNDEADEL